MISVLAALRDRRGNAVVEFAILTPVLCGIFAGLFDVGNLVYTRERINDALNTGANYAIVQGASTTSTGGAQLATDIARIARGAGGSNWADVTVVVNNGPTASNTSTGTSSGGTAANADSCYCPPQNAGNSSASNSSFSYGNSVACGSACTGGGYAGKFISIVVSHNFSPIWTGYGYVNNGTVTQSAEVQVQ